MGPNYKTMNAVEYAEIRQGDWYTSTPQDTEIEDTNFWCMEQLYIHKDIYLSFKQPIRPMHPIKMSFLQSKNTFAQAADIIEALGLTKPMELKCDYNASLIMQFFSTLVIKEIQFTP